MNKLFVSNHKVQQDQNHRKIYQTIKLKAFMHENPLNPMLTGAHLKEDKSFSFAEMTLQYFLHNVYTSVDGCEE